MKPDRGPEEGRWLHGWKDAQELPGRGESWMQTVELDQGWTRVLTGGPRWVLKIDRGGAGAGTDRWSVLVTHLNNRH